MYINEMQNHFVRNYNLSDSNLNKRIFRCAKNLPNNFYSFKQAVKHTYIKIFPKTKMNLVGLSAAVLRSLLQNL